MLYKKYNFSLYFLCKKYIKNLLLYIISLYMEKYTDTVDKIIMNQDVYMSYVL